MLEYYNFSLSTGNMLLDWVLSLVGIWALIRYLLVPSWHRWKIKNSLHYCPSIILPRLDKNYDHIRRIPSRKKDKKEHKINLYRLKCSCHHRNVHRMYSPPQDIRRLCRHLRKELERSNLLLQYDEITQAIIDHRVRDMCYKIIQIRGNDVAIGFHPKNDFVRVYSRSRGEDDPPESPPSGHYEKFTFLLSQEIWIYGVPPPDSALIIAAVADLINTCRDQINIRSY